MAIKLFKTRFPEELFDGFEAYVEERGRGADNFDEGDIEDFLRGSVPDVTPAKVQAFLYAMARRGLGKVLSFDLVFDLECEGCGEVINSADGVEVVLGDNESILLCEGCAEVVKGIKDHLEAGGSSEEIGELASALSGGRVEVVFLDE